MNYKNYNELLKELEATPNISGSTSIGWLIQIKVKGKIIKEVTLPTGTSYQTAVKIAKQNS